MDSLFYAIDDLKILENQRLRKCTRFQLGGPARWTVDASSPGAFTKACAAARRSRFPWLTLGGGSNLIVSDAGFNGIVLRYRAASISMEQGEIAVDAGADLQGLVDFSIEQSLDGLHTLNRIPGWVGGAIYGNAGAYGHSLMEFVTQVRFLDGDRIRVFDNAECGFDYRESIFKRNKDWVILDARLRVPPGDGAAIRQRAAEIAGVRDAKFPPTLRCAGSIFKNCILARLPTHVAEAVPAGVVIEGKVPSAWFLEQVGAKGMRRGEIQVADYHANLLYNDAAPGVEARAADARALIGELKDRVRERFGLQLEEEVQYVGFGPE
ncbi:MAG: UDP-N-acetylmuramate dehydrogenase [Bryobacteraceae bacterium]